ncbi:MAG: DegQ family serine endoprotease [Planctomycetes bacterium]|nr:DegQ family serine endoprotease [Planctomycetota bacterium]
MTLLAKHLKTTGLGKYICAGVMAASLCTAVCAVPTLIGAEGELVGESNVAVQQLKAQGRAFASVVKKVSPAIVHIKVEKAAKQTRLNGGPTAREDLLRRFFGDKFQKQPGQRSSPQRQPKDYIQQGQGSGFIVSADGYILTNSHVVQGSRTITVVTNDEREWQATVVGTDPESDIAVIKIEGSSLPYVELGSSQKMEVGEWILALGSPFGFSQSVTAGIISAKGRDAVGITSYENFIQTDAAINPGNSGGPMINMDGQVVGMNTAIYSRSGGSMGIGFAIPVEMIKPIAEQLKTHGSVQRGFLGVRIQDLDNELAEDFGLADKHGALIADVMPDSPAKASGMQQGDIVISFNSHAIDDMQEFRRRVAMVSPGEKVTMVVIRGGAEKSLQVIIGKRDEGPVAKLSLSSEKILGMEITPLATDVAENMNLSHGVVVSKILENSSAARAGIREGQVVLSVQQKAVHSPEEFVAATQEALSKKSRVLMLVHDGTAARYVLVKETK